MIEKQIYDAVTECKTNFDKVPFQRAIDYLKNLEPYFERTTLINHNRNIFDFILKDRDFRIRFIKRFYLEGAKTRYGFFIKTCQDIGAEIYFELFDINTIRMLIIENGEDDRLCHLFQSLASINSNELLAIVLSDNDICEAFMRKLPEIYSLFGNVKSDLLVRLVEKYQNSNMLNEVINNFKFNETSIIEVIRDNGINEVVKKKLIFSGINHQVLNNVFKQDKFAQTMLLRMNENEIASLANNGVEMATTVNQRRKAEKRNLESQNPRVSQNENKQNAVYQETSENYRINEILKNYDFEKGIFREYEHLNLYGKYSEKCHENGLIRKSYELAEGSGAKRYEDASRRVLVCIIMYPFTKDVEGFQCLEQMKKMLECPYVSKVVSKERLELYHILANISSYSSKELFVFYDNTKNIDKISTITRDYNNLQNYLAKQRQARQKQKETLEKLVAQKELIGKDYRSFGKLF